MSSFWSGWIIVLAVLTLGISFFLFVWGLRVHIPTLPDGTTGHNWDGIQEAMHKLPWWWVLASAGVFAWAFAYLVLYPGMGDFKGTRGWTSTGQLQEDVASGDARIKTPLQRWRAMSVEQLAHDKRALIIGGRLFQDNCAGCHGSMALGNADLGAPDLTDAVWQFGGSGDEILASILDGRNAVMPPWGIPLGEDGVKEVTAYVQSLSGSPSRAWMVRAGKTRFDTFCIACHGAEGVGNAGIAPSLADHTWLYGGNLSNITTSIRDGRTGVMPAWRTRLGEEQSRLVAAWVLSKASRVRPTEHPP